MTTLTERIAARSDSNPEQGRPSNKPRPDVITVRLTPALHAKLKDTAHEQRVILNGLCVAALEHTVETLAPAPAQEAVA